MSKKNNFKSNHYHTFKYKPVFLDKEREDRGQRGKHYCITCRLNLKGAMIHP